MRQKTKKRLGELLLEDGVITKEILEEVLTLQKKEGGMIGELLIRHGHITEENLIAALGKQLQMPYLPIANYSINMEAAQKYDEQFCRNSMSLILDENGKHVTLATADPLNEAAVEEVEKKSNLRAQVFITTPTEISNMLDVVYQNKKSKVIKKAG